MASTTAKSVSSLRPTSNTSSRRAARLAASSRGSDSGDVVVHRAVQSANLIGVDFDIEAGQRRPRSSAIWSNAFRRRTAPSNLRFSLNACHACEQFGRQHRHVASAPPRSDSPERQCIRDVDGGQIDARLRGRSAGIRQRYGPSTATGSRRSWATACASSAAESCDMGQFGASGGKAPTTTGGAVPEH